MVKKISAKLVIGNAFISTKKTEMTKKQIYEYWKIVDTLLPEGYYTYGNNTPFETFCEEYNFLVKSIEDTMIIDCDITQLMRYCRMGIPTEIIKAFDMAGIKLNEMELQQLNYDQENIDDVRKHIKDSSNTKSDKKIWRMIEEPSAPSSVDITNESRKKLVKSLLK